MSRIEEAHKEHINKYKMSHMIGVAEYMRENAAKYGLDGDAMYVMGLLHDIGYIRGREGHELAGAEILRSIGCTDEKLLFAVQNHGGNLYEVEAAHIQNGGESLLKDCPQIVIMCEADMSVDARGFRVGFDKRLEDIGRRYGTDGPAYRTASQTVSFVKEQLELIEPKQELSIEIYQLKNTPDNRYYDFAAISELEISGLKIEKERYDKIYSMPVTEEQIADKRVFLELTYMRFNTNIPEDFTGRAMSMSDIIVLNDGKSREAYYVDRYGFKLVPEFDKPHLEHKSHSNSNTQKKHIHEHDN